MIDGSAVSSSKNVGESFEIDNVKYVLEDTINGMRDDLMTETDKKDLIFILK